MSHTFRSATKHNVTVPLTVTKAGDVIAAICNRDDTPNVIGNRIIGPKREGYHIPVSIMAMSHILGPELGENFYDAMANPAYREYYTRVVRRLKEVGIRIAFGDDYWYILKTPDLKNPDVLASYAYNRTNLFNQGPGGYNGNFSLNSED